MAVIQKTLFAKNLDKYNTLVNDTEPNSKYFKITELTDTFTGGKNAFLIAGSDLLVTDTKILIEIKAADGSIIYNEPGEGLISSSLNGETFITEYYEGVSKVVAVYIYPDTVFGEATITILGEVNQYEDGNGILTPVPLNWEGKYNVKWQKTINVNPGLANTTKIRFYQRPQATITEILSPIYSIVGDNKVASAVTQSFANVKLSKLETFAGDVKRVKVFRTSQGDISDYDLIQDILVESKELLLSYGLSGSVVGETGILTSETLKNYWNTGSLNAYLTSSRVEGGVRLTGSGNFKYTSSLDIKSANTYELNLDAFYSSSTSSNLGVYLSQITTSVVNGATVPTTISSSIATLIGTQPTKNLLDNVIPFKLDRNYPSASLYFSQSQGEWHLGNISLKLSQDTAFSPDEISFITTMPTVLGNETYNFKFEFYDVNNNYVPVAVTQSALFTGGNNNINGTLTLISLSASGSAADLLKVSSSISGTMTVYSSSASSSVGTLSGSVSGTIGIVSSSVSSSLSSSIGYTSGSIYTLSGSVSASQAALSASVSRSVYNSLTASFTRVQNLADGNYSGSFISGNIIYAPVIGGQLGYFSTLFKVGQSPNSIYLDARQTPRKIFIGGAVPSGETEYSGAYNSTNTSVYLDSGGQFSLKDKLTWDGTTLSVTGNINISGGDAATKISNAALSGSNAQTTANTANSAAATAASAAATAASAAATAQSAADTAAGKIFTDAAGKIIKAAAPTGKGLFLDSTNLGFYNTTDYPSSPWRTYMDSSGNFQLVGASSNGLTWNASTNELSIDGNITARNGTFIGNITSTATISGGTISGGTISGGTISIGSANAIFKADSNGIYLGNATFASAPFRVSMAGALTTSAVTITGGTITIGSKFSVLSDGSVSASGGTFSGAITAGNGSSIGGWNITNSQIYVPNAISLDANTKQISVSDSAGLPRVILNQSPTLSSLTGAGSGNGTAGGNSYTSKTGGTTTAFSFNTTVGVTYIIKIQFTEADNTYALTLNNNSFYAGYYHNQIYITNGSTSTDIWNISPNINRQNSTFTNIGGIYLDSAYYSLTGDGNTWTCYSYVWYEGANTVNGSSNGLQEPSFTYQYYVDVSKTEIIPGGLQVVTTTAQYVQMPRAAGTALIVGGNITATGTITPGVSDKRLKENIINIDKPLDKINNINGVYFNFTDEANELVPHLGKNKQVGVLAQEIHSIFEEVVDLTPISPFDNDGQGNSKSGENYMTVQYEKLIPLLIEGIKELSNKVNELENKISGSI